MDSLNRPPPPRGVDPEVWKELPISICVGLAASAAEEENSHFVDKEFPADQRSLNGLSKEDSLKKAEDGPGASEAETVRCKCRMPARFLTVMKESKNKGKHFYGCRARKCDFFMWAPEGAEAPSAKRRRTFGKELKWKRFDSSQGWVVVKPSLGFSPMDVKQGSVGDCWFLSAIAVLAERSDLINRIVLTQQPSAEGRYRFMFFLDGQWREVEIDNNLPVKGDMPAFSRPSRDQIWVPLLEKAYAKAHGSFQAISGGEIAEAMAELTGCPTETISFTAPDFDSERTWERIVSFAAAKFPMGCGTMRGGNGLVGMHAYSILDVKEIHGILPGIQTKLNHFFPGKKPSQKQAQQSVSTGLGIEDQVSAEGSIRVIRLRNPWGRKEWIGAWGGSSELWTPALRKRLDRGEKSDGTFWMSYHDFLIRFDCLDICKAHEDWHEQVEAKLLLGQALSVRVTQTTWSYVLYSQRSFRSRRGMKALPVNLLILRQETSTGLTACRTIYSHGRRNVHCDIILEMGRNDEDKYYIVPFTLEDADDNRKIPFSISLHSAKAIETLRLTSIPESVSRVLTERRPLHEQEAALDIAMAGGVGRHP